MFTFEELATLLAKISACLNSRPLTPISSDPNDLSTLTPGHFLTGQAIMTPYEGYLDDGPISRLSAWQKIQKLQQEFWIRYAQEYITEQQSRNKWAKSYRSLRVGDMVFIKNEVTPPSQWLMGRVVQVFPGPDGKVRSCEVKTERSQFIRPLKRLCLLPVYTAEDGEEAPEAGFPSVEGFPNLHELMLDAKEKGISSICKVVSEHSRKKSCTGRHSTGIILHDVEPPSDCSDFGKSTPAGCYGLAVM